MENQVRRVYPTIGADGVGFLVNAVIRFMRHFASPVEFLPKD
jgi:hypothetical protein